MTSDPSDYQRRDADRIPLDPETVPRHVGIIMDGNGRWANARGLERIAGHARGEPVIFEVVDAALELGVRWLTLYAFSTENWARSPEEVEFIMQFNRDVLRNRTDEMDDKAVRIRFSGDLGDSRIPEDLIGMMRDSEQRTARHERLDLIFAFNYGGRAEIAAAARRMAAEALAGTLDPESIEPAMIRDRLYLPDVPDPELIVRTSGEMRLSNFLLWQSAYAEFVFDPTLWPDYGQDRFRANIAEFQSRQRRFGGVVG